MLNLKQGECESWNIKVAEQRLFVYPGTEVGKKYAMVYGGIEANKKGCLWKGFRIV